MNPKFKVGDKLINDLGSTRIIVDIKEPYYEVKYLEQDDSWMVYISEYDVMYRKLTKLEKALK